MDLLLFLFLAYMVVALASWMMTDEYTVERVQAIRVPRTVWYMRVMRFLFRPFGDPGRTSMTVGNRVSLSPLFDGVAERDYAGKPIPVWRHESRHVKDQARLGWGNVWVGLPAYAFLYFLCLPVFFSPFRAWFEIRAYRDGGTSGADILDKLSSWKYGKALPRWALRWVLE